MTIQNLYMNVHNSFTCNNRKLETTQIHNKRFIERQIMYTYIREWEKAMAPHSRTLSWKIPWMEEPGRLQSMGSQSRTRLSDFTFMHWRRKWQPTPVFLPGESPGTGEPGGLPSMGSHRVGHD